MLKRLLIKFLGYKYAISLCGHTKLLTTMPCRCDYLTLLFRCDVLGAEEVDLDIVHENIVKGIYTDFTFTSLI